MAKLEYKKRRSKEEIQASHNTYEIGITEAYQKELPNILCQINNDRIAQAIAEGNDFAGVYPNANVPEEKENPD